MTPENRWHRLLESIGNVLIAWRALPAPLRAQLEREADAYHQRTLTEQDIRRAFGIPDDMPLSRDPRYDPPIRDEAHGMLLDELLDKADAQHTAIEEQLG